MMKIRFRALLLIGLVLALVIPLAYAAGERCHKWDPAIKGYRFAPMDECTKNKGNSYYSTSKSFPSFEPSSYNSKGDCEGIFGSGKCKASGKTWVKSDENVGAKALTKSISGLTGNPISCKGTTCKKVQGIDFVPQTSGGKTYYCNSQNPAFCYDTDGNRVMKKINPATGKMTGDVQYLSQGASCQVDYPADSCLTSKKEKIQTHGSSAWNKAFGTSATTTKKTDPGLLKFRSSHKVDGRTYKRIGGSEGLYVYVGKGEKPVQEGSGKSRQIYIYDAYGNRINGGSISSDLKTIQLKYDDGTLYTVNSKGEAFRNGKSIGKGFSFISGPSGVYLGSPTSGITNVARFTVEEDGKTAVYGRNGQLLTKEGEAYANGAWLDESGKDDIFYNRQGVAVKGATPDKRGGYYVEETVSGLKKKVSLHHFADGKVYGEDGFFDTTYVFGREGSKGTTGSIRTYDQCVDANSLDKYSCKTKEGKIVYGLTGQELSEEDKKKAFQGTFAAFGTFGMRHFGDALDQWIGVTANRYFSLFYSDWETGYYRAIKENEFGQVVLGGIEGISGVLCQAGVQDVTDEGGSFSPVGGTSFAHIEGQRNEFFNVSDPNGPKQYQYVFSMEINPADCDMNVQPTIINTGSKGKYVKRTLVKNMPELTKGNKTFTFRAAAKSKNYYDKLCLEFPKIGLNCLTGVKEGGTICNRIATGEEIYDAERQGASEDDFQTTISNDGPVSLGDI